MGIVGFLEKLASLMWGTPFLAFTIAIGIYFLFASKGFNFRYLGHIFKNTFGTLRGKEATTKTEGHISPWEAVCIAIGGCVGTGNISGVAAAIALGGPGALFWIWVWAFFGMTIKTVEVSLASYYRTKDKNGEFYGGPTYYMEKGLGEEKKWWKVGLTLAWAYGIFYFVGWFQATMAYTISEVVEVTLGIPQIAFVVAYCAFLFYVLHKGLPRIATVMSGMVPGMCVLYVVGGIGLIFINRHALPSVLRAVFSEAFTGSAALGGFAGATIQTVMRAGISRSINSNEAGQGLSPMIHAAADTPHPVRQGLWGTMEVFVDTIIICSITALAVLCTGTWTTGLTSGTLAVAAFESTYGWMGGAFIGVMMFLFGFTTHGGAYTYYVTVMNHALRNFKHRAKIVKFYTYIFWLPSLVYTVVMVRTGSSPALVWTLADIALALPVFINLFVLFLLRGKYKELLQDYKAKYMGIGEPNMNFKPFYDTEASGESKEIGDQLMEEVQAKRSQKAKSVI